MCGCNICIYSCQYVTFFHGNTTSQLKCILCLNIHASTHQPSTHVLKVYSRVVQNYFRFFEISFQKPCTYQFLQDFINDFFFLKFLEKFCWVLLIQFGATLMYTFHIMLVFIFHKIYPGHKTTTMTMMNLFIFIHPSIHSVIYLLPSSS